MAEECSLCSCNADQLPLPVGPKIIAVGLLAEDQLFTLDSY